MQAPIREEVAPRAQTAPAPPRPTYERRRRAAEPAGDDPARRRPVRLRLVRLGLHRLVHAPRPVPVWHDPAVQPRYREVVSQVRAWDAELPSRTGQAWVTGILNRITPRFPRPPLWLARRRDRAPLAEAPRLADDRRALGSRGRRTPDPRRLAGHRARVLAPALPAVHRDRALRARRGSWPTSARPRLMRAWSRWLPVVALTVLGAALRLPDPRPAELLAGRARHGLPPRPRPRGRPARGPADRGDALPLLRRRVGVELGLRARRGRAPLALGARGHRDHPGRVPRRRGARVEAHGPCCRRTRGDQPVPRLVLAGGAVVRAPRAPLRRLGARLRSGAPRDARLARRLGRPCRRWRSRPTTSRSSSSPRRLPGCSSRSGRAATGDPRVPRARGDAPRPRPARPRPARQRRGGCRLLARRPRRRHPEEPRRRLQLPGRGPRQRARSAARAGRGRPRRAARPSASAAAPSSPGRSPPRRS